MKQSLIIRNKHLYKVWFIDVIRSMIADPSMIDKTISEISKNEEKFLKHLFKVGHIEPNSSVTTKSKVFKAHIDGIKIVGKQIVKFTSKYPKLSKIEIVDARWVRLIVDWAEILAGQASATCNTQCADGGGPFNDPNRCTDAWLAYNEFAIEYGMARDNLDDCTFQNSNPPLDDLPSDSGPFGGGIPLDPCMNQAMNVILAENNMNAAWNDIQVWC